MATTNANQLTGPWPDVAIPPGEILADTLEAKRISQAELAKRTGRPVQALNEIVKGKKEITPETAMELERVLGTPAYIWLNLERDYRYNKARLADLTRLGEQVGEARAYPYAEMARLGWVKHTADPLERVRELLRFFSVARLSAVPLTQPVAYRKSRRRDASPQALAAWLRKGELEAAEVKTQPFDKRKLRDALPRLREMTQWPPAKFHQPLRDLCANCGVALAFVPHLPGTHANGAVRWLRDDRVLVQLSVLRRYDDIFWFSLFHEVAHPLLHGRKQVFVEVAPGEREQEEVRKEEEADRFATDALLSPAEFRRLAAAGPRFSSAQLVQFAGRVGVAPSILVGRLHHEGLLPRTHLNGLRGRVVIGG